MESTKSEVGRLEEFAQQRVGALFEFNWQMFIVSFILQDLEVETTIGDLRAKTKVKESSTEPKQPYNSNLTPKMYEESLNKVSAERHVEAAQKSELEVANR